MTFKVGDLVVYARQSLFHVASMDPYIGQTGVVEKKDTFVNAWRVRFNDGRYWVIDEGALDQAQPETTTGEKNEVTTALDIWNPDYTKYTVVDAETTVKAKHPWKFQANPAHPQNYVVAWGSKQASKSEPSAVTMWPGTKFNIEPGIMYVGHNIKFDLAYLIKQGRGDFAGCLVWDTGVAHYMMTGQKAKMPSLNDLGAFYGVGQKEEGVSELWGMGVQTEDIEPAQLLSYLKQDVLLTEKVFLAQMERLKDLPKLRDHILRVSTASIYLAACELNGLPITARKVCYEAGIATGALVLAKKQLYELAETRYAVPSASRELWDPTTPKNLGRLLFDLPIEIEDWEPAGRVLKSGKLSSRRRRMEMVYSPPNDALHEAMSKLPIPKTASGAIQTSEDLLDTMKATRPEVVTPALKYRGMSKLSGTYLTPTYEWWLQTGGHPTIHPNFHIVTTNTGRSSSSGPNAQQIPPELERCINPPVGQYLVKADFKQLQICGVAMLSGDPQLIDDLNSGRDVHYETGKTVFGWKDPSEMNKEDRRIVKNTNFGLIFGGKAKGLAAQTGVSVALVQQCIDAFYARYPGVKVWVDKNIDLVEKVAQPSEGEFINGQQVREAFLQTPAGRVLRFVEREVPEWVARRTRKALGFSPNEVANYPVQAWTDGDLALVYLALLGVQPGFNKKYKPINFIHDGLWLLTSDVKETKIQLQSALDELNSKMGLAVPLKLDFTVEDSTGAVVKGTSE